MYVEPTTKDIENIRKIIKEQRSSILEYDSFSFGWVSINIESNCSIVLCIYDTISPERLTIDLVCSLNHTCKKLIDLVEEKANLMPQVTQLVVYTTVNDKLKNWYESIGFVKTKTNFIQQKGQSFPKVIEMIKRIK